MSDIKKTADVEHREKRRGSYEAEHQGENLIATAGVNKRLLLINLWNLMGPISTGFTAAVIAASFVQANFITYFALDTRPNASIIIGCIARYVLLMFAHSIPFHLFTSILL
jgi:hypothetical protein